MLELVRRGLSALIGGAGAVVRETPYFPEATRLFFLSPHMLTQMSSGELKEPYKQHVWVYACINAIAQSISSVPLLFKTGTRKDPKIVESHPLVNLFETPNPLMSGSQLIEATFIYLGLTGEAFFIVERDHARQVPKEIWVCHPGRFTEAVDAKTGLIAGWVYSKGVKKIPFQPHEVIFFRYFNPYHDYRGLAPLQAARAGVNQDFWASKYNEAFFKNSAQPGGVLETAGNLSDEEYQRVKAQWQDRHQGASKAHAIALLEGGLSYKQTGLSQKDMDFLEQRKWNREEIMAAFKVPKPELGLYDDVNFATSKTQRKLFWENTLLPKMSLFEFVLWGQLCRHIDGGRVWAEFDYSSIGALQEDRKELVDSAKALWGMGVPLNIANEYLGLGASRRWWG
ncbi:MAG: phage portal protein [Deltaproteobacteria bacterium]